MEVRLLFASFVCKVSLERMVRYLLAGVARVHTLPCLLVAAQFCSILLHI